jgi:hypothetical protein
MTPTGRGLRSSRAAGWRHSWTSRWFRPRRTSCPWLALRATRSRGYASGPREGACRRIGRACIHGRRAEMVGGCGEWCGLIKAAHENTEGSRPIMATRSPRVGITLVGLRASGPLPTPPKHLPTATGDSRQSHHPRRWFGHRYYRRRCNRVVNPNPRGV